MGAPSRLDETHILGPKSMILQNPLAPRRNTHFGFPNHKFHISRGLPWGPPGASTKGALGLPRRTFLQNVFVAGASGFKAPGHKIHELTQPAGCRVAEAQISFASLDGSMNHAARVQALQRFGGHGHVQVILCSLKAAGVGLNPDRRRPGQGLRCSLGCGLCCGFGCGLGLGCGLDIGIGIDKKIEIKSFL